MIRNRHVAIVVASAVFAVVFAASVSATPTNPPGVPRADVPTEVILDGTGPGHGVSGFIGPPVQPPIRASRTHRPPPGSHR